MRRMIVPVLLALFAELAAADDPVVPEVDAKAFFLVDASSGSVLAESNASEPLHPASLTKLMTAYLAFAALDAGDVALQDPVPVSEKAWRARGSRMFIEVDTEVAFVDLLRGLIVQSGNDAAIALAEHLAGSEEAFVAAMNETAAALGMNDTSFQNANGLPARGHISTARDLARLANVLIEDFPEYYSYYSEREYTYNDIQQHNRNELLWRDESVDGLKTGYTSAAGYCLVSSAERDGMRLVAVVLGSTSAAARTAGSMALLDFGFESYETHKLYSRGEAVARARVWKGKRDSLDLGPADDVYVTVPRGEYGKIMASAALTMELIAPLEIDQAVGELAVSLGEQELFVLPLVALEGVREGWLLTRFADGIALWFD